MTREVFVDASAWISVSDRRDKFHDAAREAFRRMLTDRRTLVTTNLVIAEAYIIIRRTGGHAEAIRFLRSLRGGPRLVRVCSDSGLESQAEELLERYVDQDFSFADAVSFVIMESRGITAAFTFDNHFPAMGFRMLPGWEAR